MISPLGRGHRGGTLSITSSRALYSSWARGSSGYRGASVGTLGPALTTVVKEAPTAEGAATAELGLGVEVRTGGVGPWRTP